MTPSHDAHELEPADITGDPGESIEILLLSAILFARGPVVRRVAEALRPSDFYSTVHADLFATIAGLIAAGGPHDSALVMGEIQRQGKGHGHTGSLLTNALTTATVAGAPAEAVEAYANALLSQAYRRSFRAAAQRLAIIADEAPESELFEQMCILGREQREATERLNALRTNPGQPGLSVTPETLRGNSHPTEGRSA